MGFRAVTDLSDYSVTELLELIKCATEVIQSKISGDSVASPRASSSTSFTVIEAEVAPVALKNPLTCEYKCRHCDAQCYRIKAHVLHSCEQHKHLR